MSLAGTFGHEVGSSPMATAKPIVFVVDDDVWVRESLKTLIRDEGLQPETFDSAQEFLDHPREFAPSCLVLDISLPGLNGLELQKRVAVERTDMPIIFITGHGDIPMSVGAMKAGAVEFLTKPFNDEVLLTAIRRTLERSRPALAQESEIQEVRDRYASLTPRERDVMALAVSGLLNKQVAGELGISEGTPRTGDMEDEGRLATGFGENDRETSPKCRQKPFNELWLAGGKTHSTESEISHRADRILSK